MSKNTFFHTRFWQDSYISDLDPVEKLLFNYCLTSPFLSLSGIYEVPIKYIAVETGIENSMVTKILNRFKQDNKIVYSEGWICILNYPKYQSYNLPNVKKGLEKELESVPPELLKMFILEGYETTSIANALPIGCQPIGTKEREQVKEQGNGIEETATTQENLVPEVIKLFESVDVKNKTYYGNKTQRAACDFLLAEYGLEEITKRIEVLPKTNTMPYFPNITTPCQLRDKWVTLNNQIERHKTEQGAKSNLVAF